jgi:hypothetical protein
MFARDSRAKIPGEEALWYYKRGAARVLLRRTEDAREDLRRAQTAEAAPWVRGRAHLEMARLAAQQGDNGAAQQAAAQAVAICRQGGDPICVEEARKIR